MRYSSPCCCCSFATVLFLLLQLLLLAGRSHQIRCYTSTALHLIQPVQLVPCDPRAEGSCYELAYSDSTHRNTLYAAGCGSNPPQIQEISMDDSSRKKVTHCNDTDACNSQLRSRLLKTRRICHYAMASKLLGVVACLPYEEICHFDEVPAPKPFYYAGCGPCPGFALTCTTCSFNMCNHTHAKVDPNYIWHPPGAKLMSGRLETAFRADDQQHESSSVAALKSTGVLLAASWSAAIVTILSLRCCSD